MKAATITTGIVALFVTMAASTTAGATVLVGSVPDGGDSNFVRIDAGTGAATIIGAIGFPQVAALGVRPSDGVLFGALGASGDIQQGQLLSIDINTGAGTAIGAADGLPIGGLAFSSGGILYATCTRYSPSEPDALCTIDQVTGMAMQVGNGLDAPNYNVEGFEGLAFDSGDALYASTKKLIPGEPRLYSVDLVTGHATVIGAIRDGSNVQINAGVVGLAFSGATLYGTTDDGRVITIDPGSGEYALVGSLGIPGGAQGLESLDLPGFTPTPTVYQSPTPTATPTQGPCRPMAPNNPCIPGGGAKTSDCQMEFFAQPEPTLKNGVPTNRLICYEGDPSCDLDPNVGNKSCTFAVTLCANNGDARFPLCAQSDVATFEVKSPNPKKLSGAADAANLAALEGVGGSGTGGFGYTVVRGTQVHSFGASSNAKDRCSAPVSLAVPLKQGTSTTTRGRKTIRLRTSSSLQRHDTDTLKLECRPSTCGDHIVQAWETCDDGNRIDGDGCDRGCHIEPTPTPTVAQSPTNTNTVGPTRSPTRTPSVTRTPTLPSGPTNTPTETPTITQTPTITNTLGATATPTSTPAGSLGVRVFTIADAPKSQFYTSAVAGNPNVSQSPFTNGPLRIFAGPLDGNNVAALSLTQDTVFGWTVLDGSVVCLKLLAAGSTGSLDCDGGTPLDASVTLNSNGANPGDPPVASYGIGAASRAGGAVLAVTAGYYNIPAISPTTPADPATCPSAPFTNFQTIPFTTETATATVTNPKPGSPGVTGNQITLSKKGTPFACNRWTLTDSAGVFMAPLVAEEQSLGDPNTKFDVANIGQFADN